jgi:cobalt-zinc-cadmium efflux system membrane fusion protein
MTKIKTRTVAIALLGVALGFAAAWLLKPTVSSTANPTPAINTESDRSEIKIPAQYLTIANIVVEPVSSGGIANDILTTATVTSLPNSEAIAVARAAGTIARINYRLGDTVKAGDVLAIVNSHEAAAMHSDRSIAIAKEDLARRTYARETNLYKQGITPRQEIETAQSALAVAQAEVQRAKAVANAAHVTEDGRSVAVVSPIAGKVTVANATLGNFIQPQTELFRVTGYGPVQIEASVTAADTARISVGDKASILISRGGPIDAVVHSITPTVSGASRSATVVLTPSPSVQTLLIGEGLQVRLHSKGVERGLAVPEDAIQNIDGHDVLFVRTKEGFRPQPVLVGKRSGGMAHIISGAQEGDLVATRNAFLIKADMIKTAKEE